ncbi:MAG: hypothetical protein GY761_16530 [Hyphomicrobiales bacterium]|nr:hypothetical protein [Hyphomicrobiales bacterium]
MAGHTDLSRDVDIDIVGLFQNIWKKKWTILILSVLVGFGTFVVLSAIAPRYRATAQLIIEPRESQFTRLGTQNGGINANEFDTAAVLSQVQIILSDTVALNTIKDLELASNPEFKRDIEVSLLKDLLILVGIEEESGQLSPEEKARKDNESVLKNYKSRLEAYSIEDSRVIELSFWANDPKLAKTITNYIADQYLSLQRNSKLETGANATKFLEVEIGKLRKKVRFAEAKVAEFRSNSDILLGNNNSLLATQQLSEVSTELSRVRSQRAAAQAKIETIRSTINVGGSLEAIPEVVASPLIQRLRERQVQLRAQISELSVTLLPSHPRLKALKSQQSDFENQIRREARGISKSLENNLVILRSQESSLTEELSRLKAEASRAGGAEVELRSLERDALSERELLQAYMSKFREAAGRQSSKYLPINVQIISAAHQPTSSYFPKTIPYSIVVGLVTAILSMVVVLVVSLLSGKAFKTVDEPVLLYENPASEFVAKRSRLSEQSEKSAQSDNKMKTGSAKNDKVDPPVYASDNYRVSELGEFREIAPEEVRSMFDVNDNISHQRVAPEQVGATENTVAAVTPPPMDISELPGAQVIDTNVGGVENHDGNIAAIADKVTSNAGINKDIPVENKGIDLSLVSEGLLGMGKTRIVVISPDGDDGSLTTWLLARKLAENEKHVVIMDMTGSGVTSQHMIGSKSTMGVGDFLAGTVEMNEVIHVDQHSTVNVVGIGNYISQDPGVVHERLQVLLEILSDAYDYLLIDCGDTDMDGLAQVADAKTVVVVSAVGSNEAKALESKLLKSGYPEAICLYPTDNETREYTALVA